MRFAPFFFFLNFGLNRPFRLTRPIQARVGPIPRESARVGAASTPVGASRLKACGIHVARRGVPDASDAGAAPLVPRPCFIGNNNLFGCEKREDMAEERVW